MKTFNKMVCMIVVLMMFSVMTVTAQRQILKKKPVLVKSIVTAKLKATAKYYVGFCPATVKMTGTIKVPKAMTVNYYFKRSEGAVPRLRPLIFLAAGSKDIPFSWTLNKDCIGWVQLIVKTDSGEVKSEQVEFSVKCDKKRKVIKNLTAAQIKKQFKPIQVGRARIIGHSVVLKPADNTNTMTVIPTVSDLVIISINNQPYPGKIHKGVTFSITIKNISKMRLEHSPACYLKMVFRYKKGYPYSGDYVSDPYFYEIPEISSMGKCTLEVKFRFHKLGYWRAFIKADGKNTVPEFEEDNNSKVKIFAIVD